MIDKLKEARRLMMDSASFEDRLKADHILAGLVNKLWGEIKRVTTILQEHPTPLESCDGCIFLKKAGCTYPNEYGKEPTGHKPRYFPSGALRCRLVKTEKEREEF